MSDRRSNLSAIIPRTRVEPDLADALAARLEDERRAHPGVDLTLADVTRALLWRALRGEVSA